MKRVNGCHHENGGMKLTRFAVLGFLISAGCGGNSPSAPSQNPSTTPAAFTVSGTVYAVDAAGRHPLADATVEIADSTTATWGEYGRPMTDAAGRYVSVPLASRHYLARATKTGYSGTVAVPLGYLEASRTLDFELTTAAAAAAPLSITTISPARGSTAGETTARITGSGFKSGATVTFDTARATAYVENSTTIHVTTPVHNPGAVDVLVTNPDGQAVRLAGAFTYAAPESFDFNGTWVGYALAHPASAARLTVRHSDMDLRFTIQDNRVTSVTCGGANLTAAPLPAVSAGAFGLSGDGVTMTGRIVSAGGAVGTINSPACPATQWAATKQ
jgi:hypothetical protein